MRNENVNRSLWFLIRLEEQKSSHLMFQTSCSALQHKQHIVHRLYASQMQMRNENLNSRGGESLVSDLDLKNENLLNNQPYPFCFGSSGWILTFLNFIALELCRFTVGLVMLFRGVNGNDRCSWCHYLSCVPTSRWSCNNWLIDFFLVLSRWSLLLFDFLLLLTKTPQYFLLSIFCYILFIWT